MNVLPMIFTLALTCSIIITAYAITLYRTRVRVKRFIETVKPEVKRATTLSELHRLLTVVLNFIKINNGLDTKAAHCNDARILLVSINSKIELLNRI